ncbi:hypothetical protein [Plesiomonas shigelloides]|uniref:hypothetical protein n=1 Tax=Plesiomonas shigelloides TaxID=703 RepID=UPI0031B7939D
MDITIPSVFEKDSMFLMIASVMALLGIFIKTVTGLLSFYEDVLIKRYFKRVNSLSEFVVSDSQVNSYLIQLKECEVFRLASGVKVSPESAQMLMKIYSLGIISNDELKSVYRFLKPVGDKAHINVSWKDKIVFFYSFTISMFILLLGFMVNMMILINESGIRIYIGSIFMFICVLVASVLISDYKKGLTLKRLKQKLIEKDALNNPDVSIFIGIKFNRATA